MMAVFPAHAAAAAAPSGSACTLAGTLNATASASTITSTARAVTVPVGNSGIIRFVSLLDIEFGGVMRVRKNSDTYQFVTEGLEVTFADTDTITLSVSNAFNVGDGAQVTLIDATNGSEIATYGTAQLYRV